MKVTNLAGGPSSSVVHAGMGLLAALIVQAAAHFLSKLDQFSFHAATGWREAQSKPPLKILRTII
jgi:hypothetical protein